MRAFYLVFAPAGITLAECAGADVLPWTSEEAFQRTEDDLGLDHREALAVGPELSESLLRLLNWHVSDTVTSDERSCTPILCFNQNG